MDKDGRFHNRSTKWYEISPYGVLLNKDESLGVSSVGFGIEAISRDGKIAFVLGEIDEKIGHWLVNLNNGERKFIFDLVLFGASLSPDNKKIAFLTPNDEVVYLKVLDIETSQILLKTITPPEKKYIRYKWGEFGGIDWSPDGNTIAISTMDREVYLFDLKANEFKKVAKGFSPIFSNDGLFAACHSYKKIHIIDCRAKEKTKTLKTYKWVNGPMAWSPDGQYIAYANTEISFKVFFDIYTLNIVAINKIEESEVCRFQPNGVFRWFDDIPQ